MSELRPLTITVRFNGETIKSFVDKIDVKIANITIETEEGKRCDFIIGTLIGNLYCSRQF